MTRIPFARQIGGVRPCNVKSVLSDINTGDSVYYVKHYPNGTVEVKYDVNLIDLLDRVFKFEAMRYLSINQERFIQKFLSEASKVTDKLLDGDTNSYSDMSEEFVALDKFLGSYFRSDYEYSSTK